MEEINGYTLINPPIQGGMAFVYKGVRDNCAPMAFKIVRPDRAENSNTICERFQEEINFLQILDHQKIVRIIRASVEYDNQGNPFTVLQMPWLQGHDLQKYIEQNAQNGLKEEKVIKIILQTLDALEYAHSKGVLHMDIKPANLFRDNNGDITIIDFGIAKVVGEKADLIAGVQEYTIRTEAGGTSFKGTIGYASLEQQVGGKLTFASDIYSLGKTLKFLCTGTLDPAVKVKSQKLSAIIDRCTNDTPSKRYQNCAELRQDLETPTPPLWENKECRNCGSKVPADAKFCPNCGQKNPFDDQYPETKECKGCGTKIPADAKSCTICGQKNPITTKPVLLFNCPRCHKPVPGSSQLCPRCQQKLINKEGLRIKSIWLCNCSGETICYDDKTPNFCNRCGNEGTLEKI